jgi:NADPH2:quinone reductase
MAAPRDSGLSPGSRVMACVDFGGYAEIANADPRLVVALPDNVGFEQAAGLPVNVLTALYAVRYRGRVREDDLVVVHGAAGGLGSACVQVAIDAGAEVIAVVSTAARGDLAVEGGASSYVIASPDWAREVRDLAATRGLAGATLVADPVGGDRLLQSLRCLAPEGRLISLGFVGGIPQVGVNKLLVRNIDLIGADWIPEAPVTTTVLVPALEKMLGRGSLDALVTESRGFGDAREILAALGRRSFIGKAVIKP